MARIVPHAELVKAAHEEYVRHFAKVPPPKIVNLDAVLTFDQPREFPWDGLQYRAPPVPFLVGLRLTVIANALSDLRTGTAPASQVRAAVQLASDVIRKAVVPRWFWRRWFRARDEFANDDPQVVEGLCAWLVDVPDATPHRPAEKQVTLDFMDTLAGFCREFPTWCHTATSAKAAGRYHRVGFPLSWAHYIHGVRHMTRVHHRLDLRNAIATRAAQAEQKSWKDFEREWRQAAGW